MIHTHTHILYVKYSLKASKLAPLWCTWEQIRLAKKKDSPRKRFGRATRMLFSFPCAHTYVFIICVYIHTDSEMRQSQHNQTHFHTHTHTHTHTNTHTRFANAGELADFLNTVNNNQTLYDSFFTWREHGASLSFKRLEELDFTRTDAKSWQCRLCSNFVKRYCS